LDEDLLDHFSPRLGECQTEEPAQSCPFQGRGEDAAKNRIVIGIETHLSGEDTNMLVRVGRTIVGLDGQSLPKERELDLHNSVYEGMPTASPRALDYLCLMRHRLKFSLRTSRPHSGHQLFL